MNLIQTHELLAMIAAVDNRRFDDGTVLAWREILADETLADCKQAVIDHFHDSKDYLMPAHIVAGAEQVRRERRADQRAEALTRTNESDDAAQRRVPLRDRSAELRAFIDGVRSVLPRGNPDALRYGHKHWRQTRERNVQTRTLPAQAQEPGIPDETLEAS